MNNKEMFTVKEWAEKSGLKLYNFDGFTEIYEKLAQVQSNDFFTNIENRFRNAGNLLCTRKAFEAYAMDCTMEFPQISQYESMSEVIPGFIEREINSRIRIYLNFITESKRTPEELRSDIEQLLNLVKLKVKVKEKDIKLSGRNKEINISELDETKFGILDMSIIKKYEGTVESLEESLSEEIIKSLEEILQKKTIKLSKLPIDKIKTLTSVYYYTDRSLDDGPIEEEFMYVDMPILEKEPFIQPFNIIGADGIKSGVTFNIETDRGSIKGSMPTTPEVDYKIRKKNNFEENKIINISENSDKSTIEATLDSLQVIDKEVTPEERVGFITRLKDFTKKLIDRLKGNNEGR